MSLARLIMRVAAARAIRGATLAEDRVFDSAVEPLDQTISAQRQPLIVVTTDDAETELVGRDLLAGDVSCDLVFEAAIAARSQAPAGTDGGGDPVTITIPHTDEGMELALDMMERQIVRALTDPHSQWAEVWRDFVPRIKGRFSRRGASVEHGVRFAARQIVLTCDLIADPPQGAEVSPTSAWGTALAAFAADSALAPLEGVLRAELEGAEALADWRRAAAMLGLDLETVDALGIGPVLDMEDDPETLEEIEADSGDQQIGIDENAAAEQGYGEDGDA